MQNKNNLIVAALSNFLGIYIACYSMEPVPNNSFKQFFNENFEIISNPHNISLEQAQIIAIAEKHSLDPYPISKLINLLFQPETTVLIEGMSHNTFLTDYTEDKFGKNITVPVNIKGWDVPNVTDIFKRTVDDLLNYTRLKRQGKLAEYIDTSPSLIERISQRNTSMIAAIEEELAGRTRKIFVIFGSDHYFLNEGIELRNFLNQHQSIVLQQKKPVLLYSEEVKNISNIFTGLKPGAF